MLTDRYSEVNPQSKLDLPFVSLTVLVLLLPRYDRGIYDRYGKPTLMVSLSHNGRGRTNTVNDR